MPLLTDAQLAQWRERVHQEWLEAVRAHNRAAYREDLYKRYLRRHLEEKLQAPDDTDIR